MFSPARRTSAILSFCTALACVAWSAPAPASVSDPSASGPGYAPATAAKSTARSTHRRARRAPPGGCYARSAIVMDPATGQILYEKNAEATMPIASITKLMTVLVFLERKPDLDRMAEVTREDLAGAGSGHFSSQQPAPDIFVAEPTDFRSTPAVDGNVTSRKCETNASEARLARASSCSRDTRTSSASALVSSVSIIIGICWSLGCQTIWSMCAR